MELIVLALVAAVIFAAGMATYRYWLKKDPEALEEWAKKVKEAGDKV